MKVLVATSKTQGAREDDFSRTVDGELVFDAGPCVAVLEGAVWDCDCSIAFRGVASAELTTTAVVADLPMGLKEYQRAVRDGLRRMGICAECAKSCGHAARMLALRWPIGTVLERDRWQFGAREVQPS